MVYRSIIFILMTIALLITSPIFLSAQEVPHSSKYYNNKGISCARNGDLIGAIDFFNKALEVDQNNAYSYLNLGIVYKKKEELDKAIDYLNKALGIDPNLQEAYTNLVDIYQKKQDFEKAHEYSQMALKINENNPQSIYNLGYAYLLEGDKKAALEQYEKLKDSGETELADKLLEKINAK